VTIGLETDEARSAAKAATEGDGRLVLVPRSDGRYSRIGTIARVENSGELGNGLQALVVRGLARGRVGVGSPAPTVRCMSPSSRSTRPHPVPAPASWHVSTARWSRSCWRSGA